MGEEGSSMGWFWKGGKKVKCDRFERQCYWMGEFKVGSCAQGLAWGSCQNHSHRSAHRTADGLSTSLAGLLRACELDIVVVKPPTFQGSQ